MRARLGIAQKKTPPLTFESANRDNPDPKVEAQAAVSAKKNGLQASPNMTARG